MSEADDRRLAALYGGTPERTAAAPSVPSSASSLGYPPRPQAVEAELLRLRAVASEPDAGWEPTWLDALADEAERPWIWESFLAPGAITFLTGLWKVGKTTFLAHLLRNLGAGGEFCGLALRPARVLVLSEEHRQHWVRRRDAMQLGSHIAVVTQPFLMRPAAERWQQFVEYETAWARAQAVDLVVFDSLPNLWPVTDENAAPVVQAALAPLGRMTDAGMAVLCLMHPSKADQDQGRGIRGSGALGGWADILIELRRHDPSRTDSTRRLLTALSRFDASVPELVLDYDAERGYEALGGRAAVRESERLEALLDCFPATDPDSFVSGITVEDALESWPETMPKLSRRTAFNYLDSLRLQGRVRRSGTGRKGDPYKFVTVP